MIGDFGISKVFNNETSLTTTPIGTELFQAPEVILEKGHCVASDIFALGIMIWMMWTKEVNGNALYPGIAKSLIPGAVVDGKRPSVSGLSCPEWLIDVIQR